MSTKNNFITQEMFDDYKKEQQIKHDKFKKEQQNKFRRFVVFAVILCLILSGIAGAASYTLAAGDTSFTPKDTTWNVENVEAALNNLNLRENQLSTHYSTEEQVVGEWVDGKPLYQKSIPITLKNSSDWYGIQHSIDNVETIFETFGYFYKSSNGETYPIPYAATNNDISFTVSKTKIYLKNDSTYAGSTGYIILQYTKTTD